MTDNNKSAQVRLADARDYPSHHLIELSSHISTSEDFYAGSFDIIVSVLGEKVSQGSLFTYLFRRFGYPNRGSDPYKELAQYLLTTTHKNMLLRICPYAEGHTSISFTFLVPHEVRRACDDWPRRHRIAHDLRFMDWIEAEETVPDWFDSMIRSAALAQQKAIALEKKQLPETDEAVSIEGITWRNFIPEIAMLAYFGEKETNSETDNEKVRWYKRITDLYQSKHPVPAVEWRKPIIADWDEEDPLKPYAKAMVETLKDLQKSVGIRDCDIDMLGYIKEGKVTNFGNVDKKTIEGVEPAPVAGYPSGILGNVDPKLFSQISSEILKLDVDPREALIKALRIFQGQ